MKQVLFATLIILLLTGCVKKADWQITNPQSDFIIVEATLTDEGHSQSVFLHYPVDELNKQSSPVTGAIVLVSNEDSTWNFSESQINSGTYISTNPFPVLTGKNYTLLISHRNKIYTAKSKMIGGVLFDELHYSKNTNDDLFHIDWVASAFSTEKAAMWEILIDYSNVPEYQSADSSSTHARLLFYTLPTLDVSEIFAPEVEKISFPAGTIITEKRFSLTPEYAEFIREMLLETNWTGGFFNTASSNVTTNLSSGAKGFFTVCGVTSLSLTVKQ